MNVNLLKHYLQWQHSRILIVFHCLEQNEDVVPLSKQITTSFNGQTHYVSISSFIHNTWDHHHIMRYRYHTLALTIDMDCAKTEKVFECASNGAYFNASYHWLLFGNDSLSSATCLLDEQNLNVDAKVTLAVPRENMTDSVYDIYDVYSTMRKRGAPLNVTLLGNWSDSVGFDFIVSQSEYERRLDFGGIWLTAAVTPLNQVHNTTLLGHLTSNDPVHTYALHRFGYRMWEIVKMKHNFTFKMVRCSTWGLSKTDGKSNIGIIGQLATKQVDLAINTLTYTKERVPILDYTVTVGIARMLFVFRHPRKSHARNILLQPFRKELWLGMFAIGLFAAGILFVNFWAESCKNSLDEEVRDNRKQTMLIIIGILCQQGFASKTIFSSTRITLFSMLLFSILVYQFYSTYIVGYLLIIPPKTMTTLKHLLDSNLKVIIEDLEYNKDYLNKTMDPVAIELYNRKILNNENVYVNVKEGIGLVQRGGYAFQCDTAYAYPLTKSTFTDDQICDLQEVFLNPLRPMFLPLPKGSPFKEMFRVTLRRSVETSIAHYWQKHFFSDKPKCARNDLETTVVDLDHVSTLFFGFLYSIVGSICILGVELMHRRMLVRRQCQPAKFPITTE
ncbi:ionotropic receptor 75a-like [Toxorhynchites rutilus septentrionalis]|uniref:ionotropic receptor 75a-like n=1 Tax=Toxorhynchites rutilus septentrionalis TaxID=329112 RepID=UPI002479DA92|nr:ionotropic receptor 75a-like [Toxorhynchites rutilus septentrionalis]